MNPAELNYTVVSSFDQSEKDTNVREMESSGNKYRQFIAGFVGNLIIN